MAGSPTVYTAFIGGAVDAAVLSALYAVKAQEAGFRRLASFAEEDLVQPQGSIVVREDLLKSEPISVERFVRGTFKGLRFARTNSAQTIRVWSRNNKIEEALGTKLYKILLPAMTVDGILNEEFQRRAVEDVLPRVGLEKAPPLDRIFDYSLVRKVKAQLEAQGWKP
jgi:ABC-type nitrate/sulfonate/bicarbonate transport system substrate-binding protein